MTIEPLDIETGCLHQQRQPTRQPAVVNERRHGRISAALQRVEFIDRNRGRCVITIEHGEPTAGPQHATELGERPLRAGYVAQARMHDSDIDAGILEVEGAGIAYAETDVPQLRRELPRSLDENRRGIDTNHRTDPGPFRQYACHSARSTADIQYPGFGRKADCSEVGGQHLPLPPLTCPDFQRLGEPLLHFRIGSRNICVGIGHRSFLNSPRTSRAAIFVELSLVR